MSWFDATGFASIAKTALKEAQRTIDKALDIQDNVGGSKSDDRPIDTNTDDFFDAWGISQSGNIQNKKAEPAMEIVTKSPTKSLKTASSLWGSFTGSFFEGPKDKPRGSIESLEDSIDLVDERFSSSKLVVQQIEEVEAGSSSNTTALNELQEKIDKTGATPQDSIIVKDSEIERDKYCLSVVSTVTRKPSSESVEIISGSSDFTTSPESEVPSTSSIGLKISESVEILADSLATPSSIEVIPIDSDIQSPTSDIQSPTSDDFASPEEVSSIEVILEDGEDNSIIEDSMSYISVSECTPRTVVDHSLSVQRVSLNVEKLNEPITRGPSRSTVHPTLGHINTQLIDTQPYSNKDNISDFVENANIIDIPEENVVDVQGDDDGSHSDRTIIANDSIMESSSDTSTTTEGNANSYYLKNMLADAMTEQIEATQKSLIDIDLSEKSCSTNVKTSAPQEITSIIQLEMPPRENSPLSSESRSDLVKIGSDETSGHTSGDENETTTSSDIEIISSPNGDSSSTQSRQSPAKFVSLKCKTRDASVDALLGKMTFQKIKGHNRELSEASSISDDSHSSEMERLLKRVSEVTEILELREAKLIEVTRQNNELQEVNSNLQQQLYADLTKQMESAELSQVTEEYTQRLSALERKFQQAIREKDVLKKQLEQSKLDAASRMSKGELESVITEKDEVIKELREEGEKLSKLQLQHSNIIKKLRVKEKDNEVSIANLKENIEDLTSESERLKRSLLAKEEVEHTQIEAVHQLTSKNKKLEYEVTQLKSQLDDTNQKLETTKKSLDAAKKELVDKNRASSELQAREQMLQSLENEKRMTQSQNEEIIHQLEDLRYKLQQSDQEYLNKEQMLRSENNELLRRLEDAERRNEELAQNVMEISKPLVRQLEALQATHNMKTSAFEKLEQTMQIKLSNLQSKLQIATESERTIRDECLSLKAQVASLETELSTSIHNNEMMKMKVEQLGAEKILLEQETNKQLESLESTLTQNKKIIQKFKNEVITLEQQLAAEKSSNEIEKSKTAAFQDQVSEKNESLPLLIRTSSPQTGNSSPTLSLGRLSFSESLASSVWHQDDQLEMASAPRYNMLELQMLQSSLKQREGEVQQLQWELNRREQEKNLLSSDISKLLTQVENLEQKTSEFNSLQLQFLEVQQKYDTLCQLYGEKVEQAEELRLDLLDVKELYKSQLDELTKQQRKE